MEPIASPCPGLPSNGSLVEWLKKQMGEEIPVQPVLALPGWMVLRKGKGDLRVISGREVASLFRDEDKKQRLEPQTVHRVTAALDELRDISQKLILLTPETFNFAQPPYPPKTTLN